jgi:hypothetical protein
MSHPQVRASGEPPFGPNWFGTYDWTEHDRAVVEEMEHRRIQDALAERRTR